MSASLRDAGFVPIHGCLEDKVDSENKATVDRSIKEACACLNRLRQTPTFDERAPTGVV